VLSISDRCGIALRAASLDERLSWYAPRPDRLDDPVNKAPAPADDVLALWQRAFSPGDRESFQRRLAWEGLDLAAVRAAVADDAPPPRTAPAWTSWLLRFSQQAVALGRDLPQLGLPIESGWIAPRDEPPFLELWIPIVRAMRIELTASSRELAKALTSPVRHAFERQWLQDIRFWGELAAFEDFRAFEPPAIRALASHDSRASTRYDRFIDRHLHDGLASFLQAHALLARQLATIAQTGVDAARELIVRLDADRDAIAATFNAGRDPGPLVGLDPGLSDPHHGRRRVMRLQFADGLTLIYKPRDVTIERGWNACLSYLARQGLSSAPPALRVLIRDGYGWTSYAAHAPMTSADQVRTYYRHAGALLCLSWIFGGRDLHAENIIATAHGPVVVDGEMLMQPDGGGLRAPGVAETAAAGVSVARTAPAEEDSTVLDTGLLSLLHRSDDDTMSDIGGLRFPAGGAAARAASNVAADASRASRTRRRWMYQRTDDLRFVDVPVEPAPLPNVVRLDGAPVTVETYADDVRDGFVDAYRFALTHVQTPIARGDDTVLDFFAGGQTRVTFRPSEQYAALLRTLAQPRFQTRGVLRSCALDSLNRVFSAAPTRPRVWPLVEEERRALERLDLPRFTARVDDRGVMPGGSVGSVYTRSGLDAARERIARLSEADLARQLTRITSALRQSIHARFHTPPPEIPPLSTPSPLPSSVPAAANAGVDTDSLRRHAEWIGRELMASGEPSSDPSSARVGADRDGRDLSTHALYSGTLGTALFYAALHATHGDTVWADAARGLVSDTRRWLDAIDDKDSRRTPPRQSAPHAIGITGGLGSLVYTQVLMAGLLRDPAHLDLAWQAARAITRARIIADTRFDVTDGAAGAAIALIALGRNDPSRAHALDDRLAACGDHLVATQVPRAIGGAWPARHGGFHVGFAHGAAGIAWALALVHSRLGDDRYRQAALRAFSFVQSQFASAQGNWPVLELDGPAAPLVPTWMHAWCHGAPGIALARALTCRDAPDLAQAIVLTDTHTGAPAVPATDHLCCGAAGQAELQLTLAQLAGLVSSGVSAAAGAGAGAGARAGAVPAVAISGSAGVAAEGGVKARTLIAGMLARARLRGHFRLSASGAEYPIADPGFFSGLSGIGYTLLRQADPRTLPSVLAFDTPATRALPIVRQTARERIHAIEPVRS
jgi:type 2 lantibiotic biosynthesis protein LanM